MPITNSWLAGPAPERDLTREVLEGRILQLLSTHNTAVVATVNKDVSPTATPLRYYSLGFEIFYTSWNDSRKSRNLRRDPRVSAGIVARWLVRPAAEALNYSGQHARWSETTPRSSTIGKPSVGSQTMWSAACR